MADTIGAVQIPAVASPKFERENQAREARPVEDSSVSQDSSLDVDKDKIEEKERKRDEGEDQGREPATYDAAGNLKRRSSAHRDTLEQGARIDLVV